MNQEPFENLRLELRRGSVVLAVLAALRREQYGYTLRKTLADHGLEIDEGTLYPLLRRLESQGLLNSQWREEDKRRKRFYLLSSEGARVLEQLLAEWRSIDLSLEEVLKGKAMEMIERYLEAVKFWLPKQQKNDIIDELSADISAQIEEREAGLARKLTEAEVEAILKSVAVPSVVANRFLPHHSHAPEDMGRNHSAKETGMSTAFTNLAAPAPTNLTAKYNRPIGYLRAFIIVLVVAHHAALAYHAYAPPPPASILTQRAGGVHSPLSIPTNGAVPRCLVGFNDLFFMSLMFFLSGLFVWHALTTKGAARFLRDRLLRLGLPFVVAAGVLAPLAYYPTYLQISGHTGLAGFWHQWLLLGNWPAGPAWFIWVLLTFDCIAALLFVLAPKWGLENLAL